MTDSNKQSAPKAYSYLRFSTPDQMKGDSLRRQTHLAEEWSRKHEIPLHEGSYEDLGVSAFRGANAETGRLGEFLEAVRSGAIERGSYLLIESLDRLSRMKARKAVRLLESICEEGITVVTLADGKSYTEDMLDDDPMSFMWAFMVAIRANEESAMKAQRLKAAWRSKRKLANEKPLTATAPAWLSLNKDEGVFEVIEERAEVVRKIFALAAEGVGKHGIASWLNSNRIPTFGSSDGWHRSYVHKILLNPAVIGVLIPHENEYIDGKRVRRPLDPIPGYYPAVVSKEIFDSVQDANQDGTTPPARSSGVAHLFAGLARCPLCNSTMTRMNKGKRSTPSLICTNAKRGLGCTYHPVKIAMVEAAIVDEVEYIVGTAPGPDEGLDGALSDLEHQEEIIIEELQNLATAIAGGGMSAFLTDQMRSREEALTEIRTQIQEVRKRMQLAGGQVLQNRLFELEKKLKSDPVDISATNLALRTVLRCVVVDWRDGSLDLEWKHGGTTSVTFDLPSALKRKALQAGRSKVKG